MKKDNKQVVVLQPSTLPMTTELIHPMRADEFKAVKRLTMDVTSIARMGEAIIQVQSEIIMIPMPSPSDPGEKRDVPCLQVLDCLRGEQYVLILSAVMYSTFHRWNGSIMGQYFAIRAGEIVAGKRYRKVEIISLERVE